MDSKKYHEEKFSKINQNREEMKQEIIEKIREKIENLDFDDLQKKELVEIAKDSGLGNIGKALINKIEFFGFNFGENKYLIVRNCEELPKIILELFKKEVEVELEKEELEYI